MLVGIDFDNTLVSYDRLFVQEAEAQGWYVGDAKSTKKDVRDAVRSHGECGELLWQRLQAQVYGHRMADAELMEGAAEFLHRCLAAEIPFVIISHKTRYAHRGSNCVDLRRAALAWMERVGFFAHDGFRLSREHVHFEETRLLKIARIMRCACTDFVDDLEEVFRERSFPMPVRRHLIAPQQSALPEGAFTAYRSWREIGDAIL